ncbi:MAG: hypothetical protein KGL39_41690 [Patescibacteria group bacterium]|nr:hypothetical protein [Patescibacteria group bacterium]
MKKVQLNFQVPASLAQKIRDDARRNQKTLNSIGEIIVRDFFRKTRTERARRYLVAAPKISGRKIGTRPRP